MQRLATPSILKDVRMVILTTSQSVPTLTVHKIDVSWIMTVDYRKLNQVASPITAAVPDVVSLLE